MQEIKTDFLVKEKKANNKGLYWISILEYSFTHVKCSGQRICWSQPEELHGNYWVLQTCSQKTWMLCNSYNCPAHVGKSGSLARLQVLQYSESQMFMLKFQNSVSTTFPLARFKKEKVLQRAQQCKSASVHALTGSVPQKMAKWLREFQHPGLLGIC